MPDEMVMMGPIGATDTVIAEKRQAQPGSARQLLQNDSIRRADEGDDRLASSYQRACRYQVIAERALEASNAKVRSQTMRPATGAIEKGFVLPRSSDQKVERDRTRGRCAALFRLAYRGSDSAGNHAGDAGEAHTFNQIAAIHMHGNDPRYFEVGLALTGAVMLGGGAM